MFGAVHKAAISLGGLASTIAIATCLSTGAAAAEPLRICASTKEAPYSSADKSGFENKIAIKLAEAMGREPEFVFTDKFAIYIVRDYLETNECDVVMGVDAGDERLLTTAPIYRSSYVMVTRQDENFTSADWSDIGKTQMSRFAVRFFTPAEMILKYTNKWEDNAAYLYSLINFKSSRNSYNQVEAPRLIGEVVAGEADMAIAFAPDVARYVKASSVPLRMTLIENPLTRSDGLVVPMQYDQAIGVRPDDQKLLAEINAALPSIRGAIDQILSEEAIPLLPPAS